MLILRRRLAQAHIRHGLKTGLASVLALLFSIWLQAGYGYWAALSAVIVMQMNIADALQMGWYRFSGTAVGCVIGMTVIAIFPDRLEWTVAGLFLAVSFCAFMTRYNSRYRMAAITVSIIILASSGIDNRFAFALFRVLEITLGVAAAVLVSLLVWPRKASDTLAESLRDEFRVCAERYATLVEAFLDGQRTVPEGMLDAVTEQAWKNHEILAKILRHESFLDTAAPGNLSRLVAAMDRTVDHLRAMLHALNDIEGHGYEIIMAPELTRLSEACSAALLSLAGDGKADPAAIEEALQRAEIRLQELREQNVTQRFYTDKIAQFYTFYASMKHLGDDLVLTMRRMCRADAGRTGRNTVLSGCDEVNAKDD